MSKFKLEIDMGNAAFDEYPGHEVARILKKVITLVSDYDYSIDEVDGTKLKDINGNTVGKVRIVEWESN